MNNDGLKVEVVDAEFIPVLLDGPLAMFGGDFPQEGDIFALQAYSVEPSPNGWSVKLRPVKLSRGAIAKEKPAWWLFR